MQSIRLTVKLCYLFKIELLFHTQIRQLKKKIIGNLGYLEHNIPKMGNQNCYWAQSAKGEIITTSKKEVNITPEDPNASQGLAS